MLLFENKKGCSFKYPNSKWTRESPQALTEPYRKHYGQLRKAKVGRHRPPLEEHTSWSSNIKWSALKTKLSNITQNEQGACMD